MKSRIFTLLLLAGTLLTSCDDDMEFGSAYQKSYQAWRAFKESSDNTYTYKVTGSSWVGLSWETIMTVTEGSVTQREFRFTYIEAGSGITIPEEDREWVETGSELGSHDMGPAASVRTMDQIYKKAKEDWLQERKSTVTYFETENDGLISLCGYATKGCADDCFRGIRIASIEALP